ncbi:MAG: thiamine-binding protein [Thermacetogeniaceae bacterium]
MGDENDALICNVSLQVIPLVPDGRVYPLVDRVIDLIRESGVKHLVGPMETTMEGDLHQLLEIVEKAQRLCLELGAERVVSVVKIDCKPGGVTIEEKIGKYWKGEAR